MKAVPSVFRYEEVPDPHCGPGDVLIKVATISIEGGDTFARWRGALATRPHIVGYQAAGEIIEVGLRCRISRLISASSPSISGVRMRRCAACRRNAWPIPDALDARMAAAIPIGFATAHDGLFEFGRLKPGETVLVQAGVSGVGIAAIQLAQRAGARVLATVSSNDRLERLMRLELGLDHGINYAGEDVARAVKRLTGGKGADHVIDPVGGATRQSSIAALAYRGRVSLIGAAGRPPPRWMQAPLSAAAVRFPESCSPPKSRPIASMTTSSASFARRRRERSRWLSTAAFRRRGRCCSGMRRKPSSRSGGLADSRVCLKYRQCYSKLCSFFR
jgi:NADPH2:quinone reductase